MRYNIFVWALLIMSVIVPGAVFAENFSNASGGSIQEQIRTLQTQVNSLLKQINVLQASIGASSASPTFSSPSNPGGFVSGVQFDCPAIVRGLEFGSRGEDVSALQQFLSTTGDYTHGEVTGYFGKATQEAVQRWQTSSGITFPALSVAYGYGIVGPQTRAVIDRFCRGGYSSLRATPQRGEAPLVVSFNAYATTTAGVSIDFGDGQTGSICIPTPTSKCAPTMHTYQNAGTYTAALVYQNGTATTTLAKTTVFVLATPVDSPRKCGMNASAVLNPCMAESGSAIFWYRNTKVQCYDGYTQTLGDPTSCKSAETWEEYGKSVCLNRCSTSNVGQPSISGIDAPTSLAVGETGTWTVKASLPNDATGGLSYSVVWGDESTIKLIQEAAGLASAESRSQSSATFTHAYARAGAYKPTFTVKSGTGKAQVSASVLVTNATATTTSEFSASPTTGGAPLTVMFSGITNSVNFGDGAAWSVFDNQKPRVVFHTYTTPGTYTASSGGRSVMITVDSGPSNRGEMNATPLSGPAPLTVSFAPSVKGMYFGGTRIDFGDGSSHPNPCVPSTINKCAPITHTYQKSGTYLAQLIGIAEGNTIVIEAVTITVGISPSVSVGDANVASVLAALEAALEKALEALK